MKKRIYKVLTATLALSVLVTGCAGAGSKPKNAIAKIGKTYITADEVNEQYNNIMMQYMQMGMPMPDETTAEGKEVVQSVREKIVEGIIFKEAKLSVAKKEKIEVTEDEVNEAIDGNIENAGGEEALKAYLDQIGKTKEEFRKEQYILFEENSYLTKLDEKLEKEYKPSKKDLEKYEKENAKDYFPIYNADHILYSTKTEEGTSVSDEDKAKIKAEAEAALKAMNDGEVKFEDRFKELSEKIGEEMEKTPEGTAVVAQPLGDFDEKTMVEEFTTAVKDMEAGKISEEVVETEFGYHIIKLNTKANELKDLEGDSKKNMEEKMKAAIVDSKIADTIEKEEKALKTTFYNEKGDKVDSVKEAVKSFDFNKIEEEAAKAKSKKEDKKETTEETDKANEETTTPTDATDKVEK